jgi:hypothetical protein
MEHFGAMAASGISFCRSFSRYVYRYSSDSRSSEGQEQESYDALQSIIKTTIVDLFMSLWFKVPLEW